MTANSVTELGLIPLHRPLLDRFGRVWEPDPAQRPVESHAEMVYRHGDTVRTWDGIATEAEPIIEVTDRRVLRVRLQLVPVKQIQLGDLVVLFQGELSPVVGTYPCPGACSTRIYICTFNGDWVRRPGNGLLLRADPRQPRNGPPGPNRDHTETG